MRLSSLIVLEHPAQRPIIVTARRTSRIQSNRAPIWFHHGQHTSRAQHTPHFSQSPFRLKNVLNHPISTDTIELLVSKWHLLSVPLNNLQVVTPICGDGFQGDLHEIRVVIDAGHFSLRPNSVSQSKQVVANPATDIKDLHAWAKFKQIETQVFVGTDLRSSLLQNQAQVLGFGALRNHKGKVTLW